MRHAGEGGGGGGGDAVGAGPLPRFTRLRAGRFGSTANSSSAYRAMRLGLASCRSAWSMVC